MMPGRRAELKGWFAESWKALVPSNFLHVPWAVRRGCVVLVFLGVTVAPSVWSESDLMEGLQGRFYRGGEEGAVLAQDIDLFPTMALYVPAGESPTPLMDLGAFAVEWRGFLTVPLRDDYRFRAFVKGSFELILNGESIIEVVDGKGWVEASEEVRLKKGANTVRGVLRGNAGSDTAVRLEWSSPDFLFEPVAAEHWSSEGDEHGQRFSDLRRGRALFLEHRCGACHVDDDGQSLNTSQLGGVDLRGVGARRKETWLKEWILHPKAVRPQATMPVVFRGESAADQVSAVLAFLRHQNTSVKEARETVHEGAPDAGAQIYDTLNCAGCHDIDEGRLADGDKIWLGKVGDKFSYDDLVRFLKQPSEHYPAIRMPEFGLSDREAANLAAHLLKSFESTVIEVGEPAQGRIEAGRKLFAQSGCINCHGGGDEPLVSGLESVEVKIVHTDRGCLAADSGLFPRAPDFELEQEDRRVLRMVLSEHRRAIGRQVARESVSRHLDALRCSACHGELEGVPALGYFGAKLEPAWMSTLFAGQIETKPRPWIAARMPAFPAYANLLSVGLSHRHGYAGQSEKREAVDPTLAEVGRQLVSPMNGFSCVSCHGVGDLKPTQVFESEGINFALSGARLRYDYYRRWVLNPVRIDPATKMPVYFDEEGNSPLYDVLNGEADRQLDAMWNYLLLGKEMVPPLIE